MSESIEGRRERRAAGIAEAGGLEEALESGALARIQDLSLSEAVVLGLMRLGVTRYVGVFGHGSTDLGEVLRVYQRHGLCRTFNVRHETAAAHAAAALRWVKGERACVVTSIGPGALQALAGSLAAASDGLGVWHIYGDETTEDEGPNMQQIPRSAEQGLFQKLCSTLGRAYSLHTPEALGAALALGRDTVEHPWRPGPFYLLLPMNTQPRVLRSFSLDELPSPQVLKPAAAAPDAIRAAVAALRAAKRVLVKVGNGGRDAGPELNEFLGLVDGVLVHTPIATGVLPYGHPRNMGVGGSKGSICGNHAMDQAELLVALGTRFVCQSDSSRTGYPRVRQVITIDPEPYRAGHYNRNLPLLGDGAATLAQLNQALRAAGACEPAEPSPWLNACAAQKEAWEAYKARRYASPRLYDEVWEREVLTQPAAIKVATDWARARGAVAFFDAGDVQANGFQVVEDERVGQTCTETGASYMGFAVSALMSCAMSSEPFYGLALSGDGSFTMNPQILIDGVQHGVRGCILLLDNRRMGAITGLQEAQYGAEYATSDRVEVDYLALARAVKGVLALSGGDSPEALRAALEEAYAYEGLALVHVPVYFGPHELGGLGAFGRWNVGNWVEATQGLRHEIAL